MLDWVKYFEDLERRLENSRRSREALALARRTPTPAKALNDMGWLPKPNLIRRSGTRRSCNF